MNWILIIGACVVYVVVLMGLYLAGRIRDLTNRQTWPDEEWMTNGHGGKNR